MRLIRVVTYNIHKCVGMDGRHRPDRILRVLQEVNADIVALQEVLSIPGGRESDDHAAYLARGLRLHAVQAHTRTLNGGRYGNLLLSRFPITFHQTLDITHETREPRTVLRADVPVGSGGRRLHIFNLHLGTGYIERRHQARRLLGHHLLRARDLEHGDRLVLGDLNEWTRGLVTRTLTRELRRVDLEVPSLRRRSFPALLPFLHLDYIYYEHTLRARDAFVHTSPTALIASDHLPLAADLTL